ncbi:MAG: hypothetical protein WBV59_14185, partial [Anaerolineae bacterium]
MMTVFSPRRQRQLRVLGGAIAVLLTGTIVFVWVWLNTSFPANSALDTILCQHLPLTDHQVAVRRNLPASLVPELHTARGLTNAEICLLPDDKLTRAVYKTDHPMSDHPGEAVTFRRLQLQDENGFIPPDGLTRAGEHVRQMRIGDGADPDSGGISRGTWTWLGPGNIGGRVRAIVISPSNSALMWAGSVSGGIWRSTNGGVSWGPVDDFMANLAVSTLVMNPSNNNIMYAGTGEGFYNADGIQGAGVFKSTNGGTAWSQLSATANADWYFVNRLAISPNGSALLAATSSGLWRSTDSGATWSHRTTTRALDVNFNPADNSKAIASGSDGSAWYSNDGGVNWTAAAGIPVLDYLGRVEVTYAPSNPSWVYASVSRNSGEIWRSTNGGQTYALVNTGNSYLGGQGWYDNIIWVDPTNANTLIVGGIDLWRSTNGGSSLTKISQWWSAPSSAHADHHAIVESPGFNGGTNKIVFFGNDGGVYRADNVYTVLGTTGWQELNNNLGITQFYGAAGN